MTQARSQSEVKGVWFIVGRRFLAANFDRETQQEFMARMGEEHGRVFAEALSSEWYPEAVLTHTVHVLHEVLARGDEARFVRIVEESSLVGINTFFRALLRLVPAPAMLRKVPTLWTLIRRGQGRVTVDVTATGGTVRYNDFPYFDDVLYRLLALGSIRGLMLLCGSTTVRVEMGAHTRDTLILHVFFQ
jgi:hypothetical protein